MDSVHHRIQYLVYNNYFYLIMFDKYNSVTDNHDTNNSVEDKYNSNNKIDNLTATNCICYNVVFVYLFVFDNIC